MSYNFHFRFIQFQSLLQNALSGPFRQVSAEFISQLFTFFNLWVFASCGYLAFSHAVQCSRYLTL